MRPSWLLTGRGVVLGAGAAGAAVAGSVYGVEEFVLLAVAVAVLFVVGAVVVVWRRRSARGALHVAVRVPVPELGRGQAAVVELVVRNEGRRRLPPLAVEEPRRHWSVSYPGLTGRPAPGGPGRTSPRRPAAASAPGRGAAGGRRGVRRRVGRSFRLPDLPRGADAALWIPVPATTRGLLALDGVALWCEDPLRLFAARVTVAPPAHVVVHPVPAPPPRRTTAGVPHRPARRRPGAGPVQLVPGDELAGLRPYAPGDRLSRLHWPALARSGDLMVREFVEPDAGSLTVLVDLRPDVHDGGSIEAVVGAAAGLALEALARGATVELCTSAGDRAEVAPSTAARRTVLRATAMLGPAVPPPSLARRWGVRPAAGAVWALGAVEGEVVLLTTASGAARPSLSDAVARLVETVVIDAGPPPPRRRP
ncbi:MAG TPA: DUF58 domain-containing protein [Acidimicrobiales bacterium]|nr:DUF58 domain-containing protein [Acidimicrobiales bacterium]